MPRHPCSEPDTLNYFPGLLPTALVLKHARTAALCPRYAAARPAAAVASTATHPPRARAPTRRSPLVPPDLPALEAAAAHARLHEIGADPADPNDHDDPDDHAGSTQHVLVPFSYGFRDRKACVAGAWTRMPLPGVGADIVAFGAKLAPPRDLRVGHAWMHEQLQFAHTLSLRDLLNLATWTWWGDKLVKHFMRTASVDLEHVARGLHDTRPRPGPQSGLASRWFIFAPQVYAYLRARGTRFGGDIARVWEAAHDLDEQEWTGVVMQYLLELNTLFQHAPKLKHPVMLFRGEKDTVPSLVQRSRHQMHAHTLDPATALSFAQDAGHVFRVVYPVGTPVVFIGGLGTHARLEFECLIPPMMSIRESKPPHIMRSPRSDPPPDDGESEESSDSNDTPLPFELFRGPNEVVVHNVFASFAAHDVVHPADAALLRCAQCRARLRAFAGERSLAVT